IAQRLLEITGILRGSSEAWNHKFNLIGVSLTKPSRLLYAVFIGIVFFSEAPTSWTLGGTGIIIASTLYTLHRNVLKTRQKTPSSP
ncbi:MAG: hypothetical protein O7I42_11110, partial [Alphaproteobacteria bacterium]|nr:hypothetical protein [Alphaproteobacteria bacterium]